MKFEYPEEVIKREMQQGLFYFILSIVLFLIFFFVNFNYGAFKGTTSASLKTHHIDFITGYWYALIGIGLLFWKTPCLMAAINRKTTKYEISTSGIYVISTLNNSRAIVRWKDITGLIDDLDKISIIYDTKKLIIYNDMDKFEKFLSYLYKNVNKAVREKLKFKANLPGEKKLSEEEKKALAEKAQAEKEQEEQNKKSRMLLDQVLEDDTAKPNAIRKTEEEIDAELPAVHKKLNQDFKASKDAASSDDKGSLINAFFSGTNEEETTQVSKSTMVMSKSVFKELTKKALAMRNRGNNDSDSKPEDNENNSNIESNDVQEEEQEVVRPMGGLRSRINKSALKKDKSSILLSSIAKQEEDKAERERNRVEFSLERLAEADSEENKDVSQESAEEARKAEEKMAEDERKSSLLSEFLTTGKLGADVLKKYGGDRFSANETKQVDIPRETVIQSETVSDISQDFEQTVERSRKTVLEQPAFGQEQPTFGQEQPAFGQEQPAFGQEQPAFGQEQPAFGQDQPAFGQEQPAFGQFGSESVGESTPLQPAFGFGEVQEQPVFGQDQPAFGQFGSESVGESTPPQPAFGFGEVQEQPAFGQDQSAFAQFGSESVGESTPPQPAFGFGELPEQPAFGQDQSAFGQEQPAFGQEQPAFGQEQPAFGQEQPTFGQEQPTFGQEQPAFGQEQPAFGQEQSAFGQEQSAFGQEQSAFGQEQSAFGQEQSASENLDISKDFGQFEKERSREKIEVNLNKPIDTKQADFGNLDITKDFGQFEKERSREKIEVNLNKSLDTEQADFGKLDITKDFGQFEKERSREKEVNLNKSLDTKQADLFKDFNQFKLSESKKNKQFISKDNIVNKDKKDDLYGTSLIEKQKKDKPHVLEVTDEVLSELREKESSLKDNHDVSTVDTELNMQKQDMRKSQQDLRKSMARRKNRKTKSDIPKKLSLKDLPVESKNDTVDKDAKQFKKTGKNKKFEKLTLDILNSKTKEEIKQEVLAKQAAEEEARRQAEEEARRQAEEEARKENEQRQSKTVEMSEKFVPDTLKYVDYDKVDLNDLIRPTHSGKLPELSKYITPTPSGHLPDLNELIKPTQSGKSPDLSSVISPAPSGKLPDLNSLIANLKSKKKSTEKDFSNENVKDSVVESVDKPVIPDSGKYKGEVYTDRTRENYDDNRTRETHEIRSKELYSSNSDVDKSDSKEVSNSSKLPDLSSLIKPSYSGKLPDLNELIKPTQSGHLPDLNSLIRPTQSGKLPELGKYINPTQSGKLPDLNSLIKPTQSGKLPDLNSLLSNSKLSNISKKNKTNTNDTDSDDGYKTRETREIEIRPNTLSSRKFKSALSHDAVPKLEDLLGKDIGRKRKNYKDSTNSEQ